MMAVSRPPRPSAPITTVAVRSRSYPIPAAIWAPDPQPEATLLQLINDYRLRAGLGRLRSRLRFAALATSHRQAASRLLTERQAIIGELEQARADYVKATTGTLG